MSSQASSADSQYVDAQGRTDAELYLMGVLDGSIVAGEKLIKLAEKMLPRIREGYKRWHYDADYATRPVEFIERFLMIPSGKLGVPFILEPYERMIVELTFGFVDDNGKRQVQYALVIMARKNGKSSLAAAIELYLLVADGEGSPQIYNAATSKAQASLAYGAVWRMVRQSPKLQKVLRKGVVTERAETGIICDMNMGFITPLSKQSSHLDGLDVHGCIFDEMAAAEDRSIFDLIRQGTGASSREQPLMVAITTNGFVRGSLFDSEHEYGYKWLSDELEDDRFLPIFFEQDDRSEVFGPESNWAKSNPGAGSVKSIEYLRAQVLKGKNDGSYMPTLLTKDFNIAANSATSFLNREECICTPTEFDIKDFRYAVVGIDAADTIDLNAMTVLAMKEGDSHIYRKTYYWLPETVLERKGNSARERDVAPYRQWVADGWMETCPGNRCDKLIFVDKIAWLAEQGVYVKAVGYDPWHMDDTTLRNMKMMVGENNVIPVRQGPQTLSQPLKQIKADMRDGRFLVDGSPVDVFCNANVSVSEDTNGNLKVIKKSSNARVDGFVSFLIGYKILCWDRWEDYQTAISF